MIDMIFVCFGMELRFQGMDCMFYDYAPAYS